MSLESRVLLDTLRLEPGPGAPDAARGWAAMTERGARAVAALMAYEAGEQWLLKRLRAVSAQGPAVEKLAELLRMASRAQIARSIMLIDETAAVVRALQGRNLPFLLIKGPARKVLSDVYQLADARDSLDVDILVHPADAQSLFTHLRDSGYDFAAPAEATPAGHFHLRPVRRAGSVSVEVHTSVHKELPAEQAWTRFHTGSEERVWRGLTVRVPCATELLWHAVSHALIHGPFAFRHRFYLDAAVIIAGPREIRWDTIRERLDGPDVPGPALALRWLGAAAELAGRPLPVSLGPFPEPLPLERIYAWRLRLFLREHRVEAWREKLLDEGIRAEIGFGLAPLVKTRSLPIQLRRRLATVAARGAYLWWRSTRG